MGKKNNRNRVNGRSNKENDLVDSDSVTDDGELIDSFMDETSLLIDGFLDKINERNAKKRLKFLNQFRQLLQTNYLGNFFTKNFEEWQDSLIRLMNRGVSIEEKLSAGKCLLYLYIQVPLEMNDENEKVIRSIVRDESLPITLRQTAIYIYGIGNYRCRLDLYECAKTLEVILSHSYLKGDRTVRKNLNNNDIQLHLSALNMIIFLLVVRQNGGDDDREICREILRILLPKLPELMQSIDVEMKCQSAMALIICHDIAKSIGGCQIPKLGNHYLEDLQKIGNNSMKNEGRRSKKMQRDATKNLIISLESLRKSGDSNFSEFQLTINHHCNRRLIGNEQQVLVDDNGIKGNETIIIDSWSLYHIYQFICDISSENIDEHLRQNNFVRNLLEIDELNDLRLIGSVGKQHVQQVKMLRQNAEKMQKNKRKNERDHKMKIKSEFDEHSD
ncbi:hypothetical protein SNEBB_000692 [Seison nebaliae]|nr:hypothetical protein SNEBB_000692 [Seison nebaliae]